MKHLLVLSSFAFALGVASTALANEGTTFDVDEPGVSSQDAPLYSPEVLDGWEQHLALEEWKLMERDDRWDRDDRRDRRDRDDRWDRDRRRPRPRPAPRPPRRGEMICFARDAFGYEYAARGHNSSATQAHAVNRCRQSSRTACYALGCRYYTHRWGS